MAATRTTQSDMLRKVYQPRMRVQFNVKSLLLQVMERNEESYAEGEEISFSLHYGQTGGYGYSPAGNLPAARSQKPKRVAFNYARIYGRIELAGSHIEGAAKSYAAEARPYDLETTNIVKQMRSAMNFDLYGDGSGIITAFPAGTPADSTTVLAVDSVRGLEIGMCISILNTSGSAQDGTIQTDAPADAGVLLDYIADIDRDAKKITIETGIASVANFNGADELFSVIRGPVKSDELSYKNCILGLKAGLMSTDPPGGAYGGLARASNKWWTAYNKDASAADMDWPMMVSMVDEIEARGPGNIDLVILGDAAWAHLATDVQGRQRFGARDVVLNGWIRGINLNGVNFVKDKHAPQDEAYCLDLSTWSLFQNDEGKWMDEDGAILSRVKDKHAYEAAWFRFAQLICDSPVSNGRIYNIKTVYPTATDD